MPGAQLIAGIVEQSLNYWLSQSACQQQVPSTIVDKQLAVELTDLKLCLTFAINQAGEIAVLSNTESADCTIFTDLSTLQTLQDSSQITRLIKADLLDLQGDIHIAQGFADWLKGSLTKWQDVLASLVGDIACYKITRAGQQVKNAIDNQWQHDKAALQNALWHEKKLTPHPLEVAQYQDDVNQVRQDFDRLAARVKRLSRQLEQNQ